MNAIRTVLVAGVNDPNNQLMRLCKENFLKPEHYPGSKTKPVPVLDAAIIAATAISHETERKVKEAYEGKPIFYSNHGVSSFKEEFLKTVYGEKALKSLRSPDLPMTLKVYFILKRFFNEGETFFFADFKNGLEKLTKKDDVRGSLSNLLSVGRQKGIFKAGHFTGQHVFIGLTEKIEEELQANDLILEREEMPLPVEKKKKTPSAPKAVPAILETFDAPEPEPVAMPLPEPEPLNVPAPAHVPEAAIIPADIRAQLELQLETMIRQQSQIDKLASLIETLREENQKLREELFQVHMPLLEMAPKLRGLTGDELQKFNGLLAFYDDNFTARKRPAQPTPIIAPRRALS